MEKAKVSKRMTIELHHSATPATPKSTKAQHSPKLREWLRWEEAHRKTIALLFESGFLYTKF